MFYSHVLYLFNRFLIYSFMPFSSIVNICSITGMTDVFQGVYPFIISSICVLAEGGLNDTYILPT